MAFTPTTKLLACLGTAWLAAGCVITDGDDDTEGTSFSTTAATGDGTGGSGDSGTSNGTNNTGGQDSGDTGDTGNDTTAGDTTAGDTAGDTEGVDSSGSGGGGGAIESCIAACQNEATCTKTDPKVCEESCEDLAVGAEGCETEWQAQTECIAALDCQGLADWLDEVGDPYPCAAEDDAFFGCADA